MNSTICTNDSDFVWQSPFYVHVIAEDENIITDIRNLQVKRFMIDLADKASVSEFSDHILSLYENYFTVDTNGHHILAKRYLAHDLMSTYSSFRMTMNLTESFIQCEPKPPLAIHDRILS